MYLVFIHSSIGSCFNYKGLSLLDQTKKQLQNLNLGTIFKYDPV
ncbi:hypothetical protein C8E01_106229 [Pontibacter virosus]|uniref:Uncharacterized protein n=1 Tax=Pontibacter virosus TaxID=1765052 RepID=A0A2U1AXB1_9BACT|nr:hypothetical protein C8E01_106229 [Pontibacter virosus]